MNDHADTLRRICDVIARAPIDCLGIGRNGGIEWPIRDEVVDDLTKAIAALEAGRSGEAEQDARRWHWATHHATQHDWQQMAARCATRLALDRYADYGMSRPANWHDHCDDVPPGSLNSPTAAAPQQPPAVGVTDANRLLDAYDDAVQELYSDQETGWNAGGCRAVYKRRIRRLRAIILRRLSHQQTAPQQPSPVGATDAMRLDWLEQVRDRFYNIDHIAAIVGKGFLTQVGDAPMPAHFPNLREAIDAAAGFSHQQPASSVSEGEDVSWAYRRQEVSKSMATAYQAITGKPAPVSEPAYTKADDLLHTIGSVEHPDAANGEGLREAWSNLSSAVGMAKMALMGAASPAADKALEQLAKVSDALDVIHEARRLTTTGQGDA